MSEDEGQNPTAQGVSPADDGEADDDGDDRDESADTPEEQAAAEEGGATDAGDEQSPQAGRAEVEDDASHEDGPETSEDIRNLLDTLQEYDDDIARDVNGIVEMARDLNGTVSHQREELEDLSERVEAQAETIGELQSKLDDREQALEAREEIIEEYETQIEDLKSHVKRTQADFQNYKKRAKKRQEQMKARATEDLVERLVTVRDNLKRALAEESGDVDSLRDGLEMTLREFDRILADENVEEIDPEAGTEVDPQRHEVMVQVDSDQPEGTIAEVFTPGYEMGEKVIQNAQVTVSNGALLEGEETDDSAADASSDADAAEDSSQADGPDEDGDAAIELGGEVAPESDVDGEDAAESKESVEASPDDDSEANAAPDENGELENTARDDDEEASPPDAADGDVDADGDGDVETDDE